MKNPQNKNFFAPKLKFGSFLSFSFLLTMALNLMATPQTVSAQTTVATTTEGDPKEWLSTQIKAIETIEPHVRKPYLPRLYVLKITSKRALSALEANGLGHIRTFQEFQNVVVVYRHSVSFLNSVPAEISKQKEVQTLLDLALQIETQYGFDDSPYTRITANVYSQIEKLVTELMDKNIPVELKVSLNALKPLLGNAIAEGRQGDRPRAYLAAEPVHKAIEDLYEEFYKIARSPAFDVALEIMGLNEYYADLAQDFPFERQEGN